MSMMGSSTTQYATLHFPTLFSRHFPFAPLGPQPVHQAHRPGPPTPIRVAINARLPGPCIHAHTTTAGNLPCIEIDEHPTMLPSSPSLSLNTIYIQRVLHCTLRLPHVLCEKGRDDRCYTILCRGQCRVLVMCISRILEVGISHRLGTIYPAFRP